MKGNEKLLAVMNQLLADELTAISQYMVHSEMCDNWGYTKLHKAIEGQAKDEMHHAEALIARMLFLEGSPCVCQLNPIKIGNDVQGIVSNDRVSEVGAVKAYNEAIALAHEVSDQASVDLFIANLKDEERHEDWGEAQRDQIEQMGLQNYLTNQI